MNFQYVHSEVHRLNNLNMNADRGKVPFSAAKLLQVWIIVLATSPAMPEHNWERQSSTKTGAADHGLAPEFDDILIREVYARAGQTLLLPCTVKNLGNKVVSWIRTKDVHILTSGRFTFTGDSRFESVHSDSSGDFWGLRIRGVHVSDTGQYECQVNTDPKMSLAISLTVTASGDHSLNVPGSKWVSQALIEGPSAVYVQNGSPVSFTCEISPLSLQSGVFFATRPPVRWSHDGKEVSFEFEGDNVSVDTQHDDQRITSVLRLSTVTWRDSGQYTCMQPSSKPASVKLIVVEGEHSEAMQRDYPVISSGIRSSPGIILYILSIFTIKLVQI